MGTGTNNVVFAQFDRMLHYPLLKLGQTPFTLWVPLEIIFWMALVLVKRLPWRSNQLPAVAVSARMESV